MVEQHGEWTTELQTYDYGEGLYWGGGDHGCELIQTELCTMVPTYEWTKIYFNVASYDTDGFFNTAIPGCLILPAGGFYACSVSIGWPVTGVGDLAVEIRSATWGSITHDIGDPSRLHPTFMNSFGASPLEQGEEIGVYVRNGTGNVVTLLGEGMLCPRLNVQFIKSFYGYAP